MEPFVTIRTTATGGNEAYLRSCIGAFCVTLNPTLEEINDVKTAVSEAVTNAIVHAYRGGSGEICVTARLSNRTVYIDVTDYGCGISDISKAKQAFFTTSPEDERSGLGFTVMETFMDSLDVRNNADGGVTVSMSKVFKGVDGVSVSAPKGVACARAQ